MTTSVTSSETAGAPDDSPAEPDDAPQRRQNPIQAQLHAHPALGPLAVLVVAVVVFACINTRFVQLANLSIMLQEVAVIGLLALGQSLIILTAGIDLSVGAAMILSQMVMAGLAVNSGVPAALAIIIGLIAALVTGLINGALVTKLRIPPFIATLGTLGVFTAVGLKYANGQTITPAMAVCCCGPGRSSNSASSTSPPA